MGMIKNKRHINFDFTLRFSILAMALGILTWSLFPSALYSKTTININDQEMKAKDLTGEKFGRLTVIKRVENANDGHVQWMCKCECGNNRIAVGSRLKKGIITSCGCDTFKKRSNAHKTHGLSSHYLYYTWIGLKERCYNKKKYGYNNYGGRGIKVCDRWLESFENFLEDMGERPSPKHSIDRIDNDGDYTPENCRWGTMKEQSNNRRTNVFITINNITKTIQQWCDYYKIDSHIVYERIHRGDIVVNAITRPKTIYTGVSYNKSAKLWVARYTINKKRYFIGYFKTKIIALMQRDMFINKLNKEGSYGMGC